MTKEFEKELQLMEEFKAACDEIINGKFILLNAKIEDLVKVIKKSELIKNILVTAVESLNYEKELIKIYKKNQTEGVTDFMPADPYDTVGVVYLFINDLITNRINFFEFSNQNFHSDDTDYIYKIFGHKMILPFKLAMIKIVENDIVSPEEEVEEVNDSYSDIKYIVADIIDVIENDKKMKNDLREDLIYVLKGISYATKYRDIRLLLSLLTAFNVHGYKIKSIQFLYEELKGKIMEEFAKIRNGN